MKRTPLNKTTKTKGASYYRKKCVELAKMIAKHRDGYKCQRCGNSAAQGFQIHASHIKAEGRNHSMSADTDNILALCASCHKWWWHEEPTLSGIWFKEKYPELSKELMIRQMTPKHMGTFEWKKKLEELKERYNGLING